MGMSILLAEMISGNFPEIIFTHSALGLLWLDVKHGRITIHHVAKKAGVAISSVSRVLSNHADVSEDMRLKVEKAVAELGYEPDYLAQSLRKGATQTIGFMIRDITNPLFSIVADSAGFELQKAGYSIILINSHGDDETEKENFTLFKRRRIDGIIASLVSEDSSQAKSIINNLGIPVVLLDREITGIKASAVICDHAAGVKEATSDLIKNGHKKIAFVSGMKDLLITRNRLKGFEEACTDVRIKIDPNYIRLGSFSEEFSYKETLDLFGSKKRPTALITGGIGASSGALQALKELKLKVGKDLAFVALDEWPMFDLLSGDLSSVYRDPHEIGRESARLIINLINGGPTSQAVVQTHYRRRSSSKKVLNG
jgi:LacI family transcriptional regulator